jgi:hypothetical protein
LFTVLLPFGLPRALFPLIKSRTMDVRFCVLKACDMARGLYKCPIPIGIPIAIVLEFALGFSPGSNWNTGHCPGELARVVGPAADPTADRGKCPPAIANADVSGDRPLGMGHPAPSVRVAMSTACCISRERW